MIYLRHQGFAAILRPGHDDDGHYDSLVVVVTGARQYNTWTDLARLYDSY